MDEMDVKTELKEEPSEVKDEPVDEKSVPVGAVKAEAPEEKTNENKKRKVALFLAYSGAGYSGMQRNEGVKTIEGTLEAAIVKAGGISELNAGDFLKVAWSRAARTDKGVSAMGQVVSLKMILSPDIVDRINQHLPPGIRVLGYSRVIGSFDARYSCDRRRYEYLMPAYAFDPNSCPTRAQQTEASTNPREGSNGNAADASEAAEPMDSVKADDSKPDMAARTADGASADNAQHSELDGRARVSEGEPQPDRQQTSVPAAQDFIFDEACRAQLNSILRDFRGTHNFHNFATGASPNDGNSKRYILSMECTDTLQIRGQQWVRIAILGQSFMLNQIRRMVGMAVAVARGLAPPDAIRLALEPRRTVDVPMAPAVGLLLVECIFQSYNQRWAQQHGQPLTLEHYADAVREFKEGVLYTEIAEREAQECSTAQFIRGISGNETTYQAWRDLPLRDLPKSAKGPGSAQIVGGQESYGMPGAKPRRGERINARSKWHARQQPSANAAAPKKPRTEAPAAPDTTTGTQPVLATANASLEAEYSE